MRQSRIFAVGLAVAAVLTAPAALAHAKLMKSAPAARATIAAPRALSVSFDDPLLTAFSKLQLVMLMGKQRMSVPLKRSFTDRGKTMVGTPKAALAKGTYALNWTAATADGHRTTGTVPFQVR